MKMFSKKKKQVINEKVKDDENTPWQTTDDEQYMINEAIKGNLSLIQSHYHGSSFDDELKQKIPQKSKKKKTKVETTEEITGKPLQLKADPYIGKAGDDYDEIKKKEQENKEMGKELKLGKEENENINPELKIIEEKKEEPKSVQEKSELPVYEKIEECEIPVKKEQKPVQEKKKETKVEEDPKPVQEKTEKKEKHKPIQKEKKSEKPKKNILVNFRKNKTFYLLLVFIICVIAVAVSAITLLNNEQNQEIPISYNIIDHQIYPIKNETNITIAIETYIEIENTDDVGGQFNISFEYNINGNISFKKNSSYIDSHNKEKIYSRINIVSPKPLLIEYKVTPPKKLIKK